MHPTAMQPLAAWNAVRKNSVLLPQSRLKQQPHVNFPSPCLTDQQLGDAGNPLTQNIHACTYANEKQRLQAKRKKERKLAAMQSLNR